MGVKDSPVEAPSGLVSDHLVGRIQTCLSRVTCRCKSPGLESRLPQPCHVPGGVDPRITGMPMSDEDGAPESPGSGKV
ncbi:MAG: hypothetical protein DSY81_09310 [Bacillota bacterium]|nr:MAG: hypothetical protein DSY92_07150 [Planctomycetota bacterium]RUA08447.1 MAG: hypothetical protein DSY81_09310 [Bacillota bacterium]